MMRPHAPLMLLTLIALHFVGGRASAQDVKWRHDYEAARKEAASAGRLLLLKFSTDWCGPCRKLEATTLRDPKVVAALNERFIPVKLDGDKETGLMAEFKVTGFPTILVVTPEGKVVGRTSGSRTSAELIALLDKAPAPTAPATRATEGKKSGAVVFDADQSLHRKLVVALDSDRTPVPTASPVKKAVSDAFDADRELYRKLAVALDGNR